MLRPHVCVVCEKVITSMESIPSLISLFRKITLTIPADAPEIPGNAVAPKEWAVFSSWDPELGDEHREYFLCTQVLYPDGSPFGEIARARINVQPNSRANVTVQMVGFPIGQTGDYKVKTWVEENQETVLGPIELKIEVEVIRGQQLSSATPN